MTTGLQGVLKTQIPESWTDWIRSLGVGPGELHG